MAIILLMNPVREASAQLSGVGVVTSLPVTDSQAVDGDILVMTNKGLARTSDPYDSRLFGVLQKAPVINYKPIDNTGQPVARTGIAEVNVTTAGGAISPGDYITSSTTLGKGQKATKPGYVIGTAIDPLPAGSGGQPASGQIAVALEIQYYNPYGGLNITSAPGFLAPLGTAFFANIQDPQKFVQTIKYMIAGLAFLGALFLGFISFSRSLAKSVEAMGRNPLAKNSIYATIVLNIVLTIVLTLIGALAAYIIIKIWPDKINLLVNQ